MIIVSLSFVTAVLVLCGRGLLQLACTLLVSPSCLCHWLLLLNLEDWSPTPRSRSRYWMQISCTTALKIQKSSFSLLLEPVLCFGESSSLDCPLVLCCWVTYPLLIFLRYSDIAHRLLISSLSLEVCADYARIINLISYPSLILGVNVFLFCFVFQRSYLPSLSTFLVLPGPN